MERAIMTRTIKTHMVYNCDAIGLKKENYTIQDIEVYVTKHETYRELGHAEA